MNESINQKDQHHPNVYNILISIHGGEERKTQRKKRKTAT
jgi:hypothetical protein